MNTELLSNREYSLCLVDQLIHLGVHKAIYCAGARNAPLVEALLQREKENKIELYSFFEERSAGFFAIGLIQQNRNPVAVFTTSGTAAAELLPSAIEAYYAGLPLVIVTADRPSYYRGSGAPQAIEQVNLFSSYAQTFYDLKENERANKDSILRLKVDTTGPTHLNVCFDEPLLEARKEQKTEKKIFHNQFSYEAENLFKPLLFIAWLYPWERKKIHKEILNWDGPIFLESASGLREEKLLSHQIICSERQLDHFLKINPDVIIIRVGGIPTSRVWRDFEEKQRLVLHFSDRRFKGLSFGENPLPLDLLGDKLRSLSAKLDTKAPWDFYKKQNEFINELLVQFPKSEPAIIKKISQSLDHLGGLFLSNSLSIREWDAFAQRKKPTPLVRVNRGANGIDGIVSTFLGGLEENRMNTLIIGDLSALYDLAGLWPIIQGKVKKSFQIVIINNGGGKIFSRIFNNRHYENEHTLNFEGWAKMFGLSYIKVEDPCCLKSLSEAVIEGNVIQRIIEVVPNFDETELFWKQHDQGLISMEKACYE